MSFNHNRIYFSKLLEPGVVTKHNIVDFPHSFNNLNFNFIRSFDDNGIVSSSFIESKYDITNISIDAFSKNDSSTNITDLFDVMQYSGVHISFAVMTNTDLHLKEIDEYGIFNWKNSKTVCIQKIDNEKNTIVKKFFNLENALKEYRWI